MLVDVHCHLSFPHFEKDLDKVIERAKIAGMTAILCSGVDPETNREALELSKKYEIVKASLGIYPLDAVGLGHYDDTPRERKEFDVDSEIEFIRKNKNKMKAKNVVLHCFTGNMKLVERAENLGYYFSIPSIITRLKHFQELADRVSLNNLLTETDAPYLSPVKGERSEPSFVKEIIKKISEIKKVEETEVEKIIFSNYQKIFLKK